MTDLIVPTANTPRPKRRWHTAENGTRWYVDRASLEALTDLGMSDAAIGRYFRVEREDVERLRQLYGLPQVDDQVDAASKAKSSDLDFDRTERGIRLGLPTGEAP